MVRALLIGLLLLLPALAWAQRGTPTVPAATGLQAPPYPFSEGSIVGVVSANPQTYRAIFINTVYPQYTPTPNQWQTINWADYGLPANIKGVLLGGILFITHGAAIVICNETLTFDVPGSTTDPGFYIFQAMDPPNPSSGVRQTAFTVVPVKNGQTAWMWRRGAPGQYPDGDIGQYPAQCAYGANLNVQGYIR